MSDLGINSNIYYVSRQYLERLNNFVIEANYSATVGKSYFEQEIVDFFEQIRQKRITDPHISLIWSFFNFYYREKHKDTSRELNSIYARLKNKQIDQTLLKELGELVDVLNEECVNAYSKMKGKR